MNAIRKLFNRFSRKAKPPQKFIQPATYENADDLELVIRAGAGLPEVVDVATGRRINLTGCTAYQWGQKFSPGDERGQVLLVVDGVRIEHKEA